MYLPPREQDRLLLGQAGFLAQRRLARGLCLNYPEALALIASQLQERIRDGAHSVAELMALGKTMLGRKHVLPSIPSMLDQIQVEGTFPDGVFLVTVHDPICTEHGDISVALYGSFLPIPDDSLFPSHPSSSYDPQNLPGAIILNNQAKKITINPSRHRIKLNVTNRGDRPIQVGSHYHFIETNPALSFDRALAYGSRLDIPAGTAVRFEPGDSKSVTLVAIGGHRIISGGNGLASGPYDPSRTDDIVANLIQKGFAHFPEPAALKVSIKETEIEREAYVSMYGPTTGDRIRLGDTNLWIRVEWDESEGIYGEEAKFGGGKTIREGMAQATNRSADQVMDLVITNAVIIDWQGIYKADIGIKNGLIAGIGKAGNPDISPSPPNKPIVPSIPGIPDISPRPTSNVLIPIGSSTEILSAEHLILTPGTIDVHIHYICPQQITEALYSGTTTFIGGGTGPAEGTKATTCTSSEFYLKHMMAACDGLPGNFGFTAKGNDSGPTAMEEAIKAGACGLKIHEDWGSTPQVIRTALNAGDKWDVQVNIHTDTLNESGFVEKTIEAFEGRTIHTYHTEGAGGGHAPDIIRVCGEENVLPSSTNPTRPFAKNTLDEHLDMLMVCHHLSRHIPEDLAFAESRIRAETVAAEDVLHDIGAISMISSDSQAMGRIAEVVSRTWRTASKMRALRGPLKELGDEEEEGDDNGRVKRYISKYTINPAIAHGISSYVGQIKIGCLADLVLWKPSHFGSSSPEIIIKSGVIVASPMGDPNGSIPTVQPCLPKPMFGAYPGSAALNSVFFVSKVSLDGVKGGKFGSYGLRKRGVGVSGCRGLKKGEDMKWNRSLPKVEVDPESYEVKADGEVVDVEPAKEVCLARVYNLF